MDTDKAIKYLRGLKFVRERRLWEKFMRRYNCQKIAELGVFRGQNFKRMIEHSPLFAVGVDIWPNRNRTYDIFKADMKDKPFVKIIREPTVDAARYFTDKYFDFIYVDADHTYQGCFADLVAWYPKLKNEGFMVGDDYTRTIEPVGVKFEVKKAVTDFAQRLNLLVYEIPGNGWSTGWAVIKP